VVITVAVGGAGVELGESTGEKSTSRIKSRLKNHPPAGVTSMSERVGEGSAVGVDGGGWSEVDPSGMDGEIPALEVDLLVVAATQQAAVLVTGVEPPRFLEPVVDRLFA
jgi:hypothetical protein